MIALLLVLFALGGDLEEADRAYRAGEYAVARTLYEEALGRPGFSQGALFHNLAACAHHLGELPQAVWYYRRALRKRPGDGDALSGLSLALQELQLPPQPWFSGPELGRAVPPWLLLLIAAGLQALGLAGLVLRARGRAACALLLALGLLAGAWLLHLRRLQAEPLAVALSDPVAVRAEPHHTANVVAEVRAGETWRVEESSDRWVRLSREGRSGWGRRSGLGMVD